MLLFGHVGITLGAALLLKGLTNVSRPTGKREEGVVSRYRQPSRATTNPVYSESDKPSWVESLAGFIDIRLLLIGSMLPDIIDKPVGHVFFRDTFSNGRIFSHTLLFLAVITIIGLFLYRPRQKTWLLALSFGTFVHLILDEMWRSPHTLLWPVYGFAFDKFDLTNWAPNIRRALFTDPQIYIPELVGLAVLAWFAWSLVRRGTAFAFLKYGTV